MCTVFSILSDHYSSVPHQGTGRPHSHGSIGWSLSRQRGQCTPLGHRPFAWSTSARPVHPTRAPAVRSWLKRYTVPVLWQATPASAGVHDSANARSECTASFTGTSVAGGTHSAGSALPEAAWQRDDTALGDLSRSRRVSRWGA